MLKLKNLNKLILALSRLCVASTLVLATSLLGLARTPFVTETLQDINEALVNIPERVPNGPEVRTLAGVQITPGDVTRDFRTNKEIYDDTYVLQEQFTDLMQHVLNLKINPTLLPTVENKMYYLIAEIRKMGIRYGYSTSFALLIEELVLILNQIKKTFTYTDVMLFKARIEVIQAEIENALLTKLVT